MHLDHCIPGEGEYDRTERLIRTLLAERGSALPVASSLADPTPRDILTPESYLGYKRLDRYAGSPIARNREVLYRFPTSLASDQLAYAGSWRVESERIVAGNDARLRLRFHANNVYLVLGGHGRLQVLVDGRRKRTLRTPPSGSATGPSSRTCSPPRGRSIAPARSLPRRWRERASTRRRAPGCSSLLIAGACRLARLRAGGRDHLHHPCDRAP